MFCRLERRRLLYASGWRQAQTDKAGDHRLQRSSSKEGGAGPGQASRVRRAEGQGGLSRQIEEAGG